MSSRKPKIFVALDEPNPRHALELSNQLNPKICGLKIGKALFTAGGPTVVNQLIADGFQIFLDLKFHDIPNTVANACIAAADLGVWMLNIHLMGGLKMIDAAKEALQKYAHKAPKLIGVTLLTSLGQDELTALKISSPLNELVQHLAHMAASSCLDGIVCSPQELPQLRKNFPRPFYLVTPGIRPDASPMDDQTRTTTPKQAVQSGSDILVIGRPITNAHNPLLKLEQILAELSC